MQKDFLNQIIQLNQQCMLCYQQDQYEQALDIAKQARDLAYQHLGEKHPVFAVILSNLGMLYCSTGHYTEAEALYQQALAIQQETLGEIHPHVAASLNNLAELYRLKGEHGRAKPLLQQALDILRAAPAEIQPRAAAILNNLAAIYRAEGNYVEAESLLQQAMAILRQSVGEDNPQIATYLNNLAELAHKMGKYAQAEPLYCQALAISRTFFGDRSLQVSGCLGNLAELYKAMGNFTQAEPLYQETLKIQRQILGEEHPTFAISLNNLAELYREVGKYMQAEQLYQQSLDIKQKVLGEAHPSFATGLNNLAGLYLTKGNYNKAELLFRQVLALQWNVLGEIHPDVAQSLNNLAELYREKGSYVQAESLCKQALAIRRRVFGEIHPDVAQSLNNLALLSEAMCHYTRAEQLHRQALDIWRESLGEAHPAVAVSLNNLAALYGLMGDYTQVEALCRQGLAILYRAFDETHPSVANIQDHLADLYQEMGDYVQAEALYQTALTIRRKAFGEQHPLIATSLKNMAGLYREIGDYTQAELLYRQALNIEKVTLGEAHPDFASSLNDLAGLYEQMGTPTRSASLYRQALATFRTTRGETHPLTATATNNLAGLYQSMGNYAEAELLYQKALEARSTMFGETHPEVARILHNLAELYREKGDYARAEALYRQALDMKQKILGRTSPSTARVLENLAQLYTATDRPNDALTFMGEAAFIDDQQIEQVFSLGSERQRLAYMRTLQSSLAELLSLVFQQFPHTQEALQKAMDIVLRRKAIAAEASAMQRDAVMGGRYPLLQPRLSELTALRNRIAQKTLAGPDLEDHQFYLQQLAELNRKKEQLESELARQIPEIGLIQRNRVADRLSVARALPEDAVLIDFVCFKDLDFKAVRAQGDRVWGPERYVAFILFPKDNDQIHLIDLGEAKYVDDLIVHFREMITGNGLSGKKRHVSPELSEPRMPEELRSGMQLRKAIFDPLLPVLKGCKQLFLSLDGELNRLPFEVLPMENQHYVIDEYFISYLASGRDILRFQMDAISETTLPLVIADPDFDLEDTTISDSPLADIPGRQSRDMERGSWRFERLQGTRIEGEQLAKALNVQPWLGKAALEGRLKKHRSPGILHIATHGFFLADQKRDPNKEIPGDNMRIIQGDVRKDKLERFWEQRIENPLLRSGLALAGVNVWNQGKIPPSEAEDGILTAEDVSGLDLLDTELTVLSACETGLGETHVGEGVFGLRRAFVLAGTRTLVMSLWKVPDLQTQELMETFYSLVLSGQPRRDALREAQLVMKAKYSDPYYWGAFICQGNPGPLSQKILRAKMLY